MPLRNGQILLIPAIVTLVVLLVNPAAALRTIGVELVDDTVSACAGGKGIVRVRLTNHLTSPALLEFGIDGQGLALLKDVKRYNLGVGATTVIELSVRVADDSAGTVAYTLTCALEDTPVAVRALGAIDVRGPCSEGERLPPLAAEQGASPSPTNPPSTLPLVVRARGYSDERTLVFGLLVAAALVLAAITVVRTKPEVGARAPVTGFSRGSREQSLTYRPDYPPSEGWGRQG